MMLLSADSFTPSLGRGIASAAPSSARPVGDDVSPIQIEDHNLPIRPWAVARPLVVDKAMVTNAQDEDRYILSRRVELTWVPCDKA
jgi:hypothetical protein